ncbi:hypothetical protein HMPREF0308_0294, partial [Corynebacterium striatum ATCC 6940]
GAKLTINEKAYGKALSLAGRKGDVTSCPKNSCLVEMSLAFTTSSTTSKTPSGWRNPTCRRDQSSTVRHTLSVST